MFKNYQNKYLKAKVKVSQDSLKFVSKSDSGFDISTLVRELAHRTTSKAKYRTNTRLSITKEV
jgi:hypothetical protein